MNTTLRRLNLDDGSGWGVHVSWIHETTGRLLYLDLYSVCYPTRVPRPFYLANRDAANGKNWYPRINIYGHGLFRSGNLRNIDRHFYENRKSISIAKSDIALSTPVNVLHLFKVAAGVRRTNGPAHVLIDAFLDTFASCPEIQECLNFVPTPSASYTDTAHSGTSS
jgi:hypothetical protein